jgi:hypothetical protein
MVNADYFFCVSFYASSKNQNTYKALMILWYTYASHDEKEMLSPSPKWKA